MSLSFRSLSIDTRAGLWMECGRYSAHVTRTDASGPAFLHRATVGRFRTVTGRLGRLSFTADVERRVE